MSGDEHEEAYRQHAVHAHHRPVGVIGREGGADLVIAHDGQVDKEAEHPSAQEVPEAHGDEEHHGPFVREGGACGADDRACLSWAPSRMNRHASKVKSTSGITSIAEKTAPIAM